LTKLIKELKKSLVELIILKPEFQKSRSNIVIVNKKLTVNAPSSNSGVYL